MLVRMLKSKDSRFSVWRRSLAQKHPVLGKILGSKRPAFAKQTSALAAFYRLGPRAAPAIPKIIPLMDDPDRALVAVVALMYIGPERERDVLSFTNVLRIRTPSRSGTTPDRLRAVAILAMSKSGPKAAAAVPFLIGNLSSTNGHIAAASAVALARIGGLPKKIVPLIIAECQVPYGTHYSETHCSVRHK